MMQSCARANRAAAFSRVVATARWPARLCATVVGLACVLATRTVRGVLSILLPAAVPGRTGLADHGVRVAQPSGSSAAPWTSEILRYAMARRGPPGACISLEVGPRLF
ncbi:hypothetical protein FDG2_5993 [Candidatus Protofrankia californiensis]|uniref:Uncharacterized protein n=1 Tax=Candidatus Protofrankia californiensis TaxID=1839754 RepID=A0A1C3PG68_9ACTN|nr:hypothetical protein FDG2_5993 [Candidatus Protofrankia californiensis]